MRKFTKVVSVVAVVITTGTMMRVVHASSPPPDRIPVKVEQTGRTNSYYVGPPNWGHNTTYDLKVVDNKGGHYGLGTPYEAFGSVIRNQENGLNYALQDAPGTPSGPEYPWPEGALFEDINGWYLNVDTGKDTFWYSFRQHWHDIRVSDNKPFRLNVHTVSHFQGYVTRTY